MDVVERQQIFYLYRESNVYSSAVRIIETRRERDRLLNKLNIFSSCRPCFISSSRPSDFVGIFVIFFCQKCLVPVPQVSVHRLTVHRWCKWPPGSNAFVCTIMHEAITYTQRKIQTLQMLAVCCQSCDPVLFLRLQCIETVVLCVCVCVCVCVCGGTSQTFQPIRR